MTTLNLANILLFINVLFLAVSTIDSFSVQGKIEIGQYRGLVWERKIDRLVACSFILPICAQPQ